MMFLSRRLVVIGLRLISGSTLPNRAFAAALPTVWRTFSSLSLAAFLQLWSEVRSDPRALLSSGFSSAIMDLMGVRVTAGSPYLRGVYRLFSIMGYAQFIVRAVLSMRSLFLLPLQLGVALAIASSAGINISAVTAFISTWLWYPFAKLVFGVADFVGDLITSDKEVISWWAFLSLGMVAAIAALTSFFPDSPFSGHFWTVLHTVWDYIPYHGLIGEWISAAAVTFSPVTLWVSGWVGVIWTHVQPWWSFVYNDWTRPVLVRAWEYLVGRFF